MNVQVIAELLKYLGLIVGTASAVWGTVNELKEVDANGKKRLNAAGKTSIAITVISLIVSLTSAAVADKLARDADRSAETKRQAETNKIIMAGQSLRDISLTWTFPNGASIAKDLFSQFEKDVKELDEEWGRDPHWNLYYEKLQQLNYDDVVRSMLLHLGGADSLTGSTLAMFKLDDTGSVVLPVGFLEVAQLKGLDIAIKEVDVAAGIELSGEGSPEHKRKFTSWLSLPDISQSGTEVKFQWNLSGVNSVRAIDKADPSLIAVLPHQMQVVVLTSIETLPVNPSETSEATFLIDLWHESMNAKEDLAPVPLRASRLRLVPNGVESMALTYEMKLVEILPLSIREPEKRYCRAAIWTGTLREAGP